MEKEFKITESLANQLLNYLASRPYIEVARLVQALSSITEVTQETKVETADKSEEEIEIEAKQKEKIC